MDVFLDKQMLGRWLVYGVSTLIMCVAWFDGFIIGFYDYIADMIQLMPRWALLLPEQVWYIKLYLSVLLGNGQL
jgi:hypothetical protein